MTTYRTAYSRIENGMECMTDASGDAINGDAASRFIDQCNVFKAELDALTAARLKTSSEEYTALTNAMANSRQELEDMVRERDKLVKVITTAAKIVGALPKIIAII
jgi:hypothetical protein